MKKIFYLAGLCILILTSCKQNNRNDMLVCKVSDIQKVKKEFLLSELTKKIDVVRLETNDSCLLKLEHVFHVFVTDNYIGIMQRGQNVSYKLFDRRGHFIANIGSKGQGPHEYLSLYGAFIDEVAKRIYLVEVRHKTDRLLCFDLTGKYIADIPLHFKPLDLPHFVIQDSIITVTSSPISNKTTMIFQQNMKGELIQSIPPFASLAFDNMSYDNEVISSYNNGILSFHLMGIDTLFHYDAKSNCLVPRLCIQYNQNKYTPCLFDWPKHFYIWSNTRPPILVDKKTGKAGYYAIKNDFLGDIEISGLEMKYIICDNDYVVVCHEAFQLREDLEKAVKKSGLSPKVRDRMTNLINSINDDDNPVLVVGKLK